VAAFVGFLLLACAEGDLGGTNVAWDFLPEARSFEWLRIVDEFVTSFVTYGCVLLVAPFLSCRAIMTPDGQDDKQWLMFWVIWSTLEAVERHTSNLHTWPFYHEGKAIFTVYLLFFDGSAAIFRRVVDPIYNRFAEVSKEKIKELDMIGGDKFIRLYGTELFERVADASGYMKVIANKVAEDSAQRTASPKTRSIEQSARGFRGLTMHPLLLPGVVLTAFGVCMKWDELMDVDGMPSQGYLLATAIGIALAASCIF